ncbi:hypothetical protein NC651_027312 [Populus alba x Populus x berolinensis]|nr:hypothetical protein NC651_027312 [Populus alba x Populus x berolinensis]
MVSMILGVVSQSESLSRQASCFYTTGGFDSISQKVNHFVKMKQLHGSADRNHTTISNL